jgi:hypothetical protein
MEIHGVKIDFMGLAAVITSVVSLLTIIKAKKNKGVYRDKTDETKSE